MTKPSSIARFICSTGYTGLMGDKDKSYKLLFSHAQIVKELLVETEIAKAMDGRLWPAQCVEFCFALSNWLNAFRQPGIKMIGAQFVFALRQEEGGQQSRRDW